MTSKIKVDNINKVSDDSNIIKKCGTTTTIGSGASNPIVVDGSAVTIGRCGGTVALASGASQTGFGSPGQLVDWQTGSIKTATFTAVSGEGYFANTTGSAFNMNLPAGSAGAIVSVADYAATFQTNNLTIVPNGTDKIGSVNANVSLSTKGQSITLVYVDGTQGWINTEDSTSNVRANEFLDVSVSGVGNTIQTDGDYKLATFISPGTFCVAALAVSPSDNTLDYLVVAGGGGGNASVTGGGGGGGGFRYSAATYTSPSCAPAHPLRSPTGLTATIAAFPVTVGAGGAGNPGVANGSNSIFSTITSTGGGRGAQPGGSGGGTQHRGGAGGSGNTPPVSPPQGQNGGASPGPTYAAGGGGGAVQAGQDAQPPGPSGNGGYGGAGGGLPNNFGTKGQPSGSFYYFSGGGGGGGRCGQAGAAGLGGGGPGGNSPMDATANTGGGGGGHKSPAPTDSGAGGSGIVIIRYKFQ